MIGLPDNADFQTFVSGCFPLHKMLMKRRLRFFFGHVAHSAANKTRKSQHSHECKDPHQRFCDS